MPLLAPPTAPPPILPPRQDWPEEVRLMRDLYEVVPGNRFLRREFGYYSQEAWAEQGLDPKADYAREFGFDPNPVHTLGGLGWCEAAFSPGFEEKVVETRGDCEVIQDHAGRHLLVFTGRRHGFMPDYIHHPVTDRATWERDVAWRLDPTAPGRWQGFDERMAKARAQAARGLVITQGLIGGYMYLRSLLGPEELLYAFYDAPDLLHDCMRAWLRLADAVIERHQQHVVIDEIFFAEDICYNAGPLIGPDMIREFLFPYYQQVIANLKSRQAGSGRKLHVHVDTDGDVISVIDLYRTGIGMDRCSPFEVASGCDVVAAGRRWPDLVMDGGIDKRVLAQGPAAIDRMLERILPAMRERGGYYPTCDHGVPPEVSLANYRHYRKRCLELGG